MELPSSIEECDRRLGLCRQTLKLMQVRSSQKIVLKEIDELLDQRLRLHNRAVLKAFVATDRGGR